MADRVDVYDKYNRPGTVDAADVNALVQSGGRVATPEDLKREQMQAEYAQKGVLQKAGGVALQASALGLLRNIPAVEEALPLPPTLEAAAHGMRSGTSGGLAPGLTYQALKQVDPEAAKAYQEKEKALRQDLAYQGGEIASMVGGAFIGPGAGAGRLLPTAGISALGGAAERVVARQLAKAGAEGALARAGVSALSLGAQGATEAAIQGAAHEYGEQLLGDHETNAEKIFAAAGTSAMYGGAGGALLGGAGSLAKSAVSSLAGSARRGLSRIYAASEEGVAKVGREGAPYRAPAEGEALTRTVPDRSAVGRALSGENEGLRDLAADQAWRAVGDKSWAGKWAKEANARAGGTRAVGKTLLEEGVFDAGMTAEGGPLRQAFAQGMDGKPADLLPKIAAARMKRGHELGEILASSNATVKSSAVVEALEKAIDPYRGTAANLPMVARLENYVKNVEQVLGVARADGKIVADPLMPVQQLTKERQALQDLVYRDNRALDPNGTVRAMREMRASMAALERDAIEDAAAKAGSPGLKEKILDLNRRYQHLSIAEEAAEDAAAKMSRNRWISLTDTIAAGSALAAGHPLAAPVVAVGHKLLRERGSAAAAVLLSRLADTGAMAKMLRGVDEQIARSAKGLLLPPAKGGALPPVEPAVARANRVIQAVRMAERDKEETMDRVQRQTQALSGVAPRTAEVYAGNVYRAMGYLAQQIPPAPTNTNPFRDQGPRMTPMQAARIARLGEYVEQPLKFFQDVERGLVTPEGVEMAKLLMPKSFEQLQVRTLEAIAEARARGKQISLDERMRISMILDIQGDASLRPGMAKLLQENVSVPPAGDAGPSPGQAPNRPINLDTQPRPLDRIESR